MRTTTARSAGVHVFSYRASSTLSYVCCLIALFVAVGVDPAFGAEGMEKQIQLDIPAGTSLEDALLQWGNRTGMQVMMSTEVVRNERVQAIQGTTRASTALSTLLRSAGLSYTIDGNTVHVVPATTLVPSTSWRHLSDSSGSMSDSGAETQAPGEGSIQTTESNVQVARLDAASNQNDSHGKSLEEVVVTAQKRSERLQDVPISISVLGGESLDNSTFSGVTEALNTVPGVAAFANQSQEAGTILSIRGVSAGSNPLGSGASTVAYYVDGVPFGMVRSSILPDPDIYDLSRVEVLRGPQGTLYGANALNGVVRVLTSDPDLRSLNLKLTGDLSTTEGGGGNYAGDAAVNLPIVDGELAARLVVGDQHYSGWLNGPQGSGLTNLNDADQSNVRLKIAAQPTDALTIGLSAWHSQSNYGAPSQSDSNDRIISLNPQPMTTSFNALGTTVVYQVPFFTMSSTSSYVYYKNNNQFDLNVFGGFNYDDHTNITSRVFSEELNLTSKLEGPWSWSAGVFYRDDKDTYLQFLVPYSSGSTLPFDHFYDTSRSEAVYGELSRRFLNDKLQWTLGARYFHDDAGTAPIDPSPGAPPNRVSATSSATTPRVVLTWFPNKSTTAYVSYSQGFRSGLPQDYLVGAVVPDFPATRPDKLSNYEVGVKGTFWDERIAYDADVFYMDWKDIQQVVGVTITSGPAAGTGVSVLLNGQSASGEGAEFSVTMRPMKGVTLGANFGWNNLHFDSTVYSSGTVLFPEGSRPDVSPEYTAGVSAQYVFPIASGVRGVFSASGNYISPLTTTYLNVAASSAPESNSLLLTRGTFDIEFPQHWSVGLFVDNANNWNGAQQNQYELPGLAERQRPRTYGVRFDYHFR